MCSNCTFMELKYNHFANLAKIADVQIVPLWNWNSPDTYSPSWTGAAFKLYLYGIEIRKRCDNFVFSNAFKLYLYGIEIVPKDNGGWLGKVQIVPLWNWNIGNNRASNNSLGSNCTFMELKYQTKENVTAKVKVQIVPLWNWN